MITNYHNKLVFYKNKIYYSAIVYDVLYLRNLITGDSYTFYTGSLDSEKYIIENIKLMNTDIGIL